MKIKNLGEHEVKCTGCGAVLVIEVGDVNPDETGHIGFHYPGLDCTVTCCNCGHVMLMKSVDLPREWARRLFP